MFSELFAHVSWSELDRQLNAVHTHTIRFQWLTQLPKAIKLSLSFWQLCLNTGLNIGSEVRNSRRIGSWVKLPDSTVTSLFSLITSFQFSAPVSPHASSFPGCSFRPCPSGCMNKASKNKSTDWGEWGQAPKRGTAIWMAFGVVAISEYANSFWHMASSRVLSCKRNTGITSLWLYPSLHPSSCS